MSEIEALFTEICQELKFDFESEKKDGDFFLHGKKGDFRIGYEKQLLDKDHDRPFSETLLAGINQEGGLAVGLTRYVGVVADCGIYLYYSFPKENCEKCIEKVGLDDAVSRMFVLSAKSRQKSNESILRDSMPVMKHNLEEAKQIIYRVFELKQASKA